MDLTLSPSEQKFRDELRAWLEANHPGPEPEDPDEAFEYRRRWQRKLHEGGWAGVSWPREYGGRGATVIEQAIYSEEMVRAKAPQPANILGLLMAGPTIIAHGTDAQKASRLANILSAEEIWCQGFSEPQAGSDLSAVRTSARLEGSRLVVDGQKVWSSYAHIADWCLLIARSDSASERHAGLTCLIVDVRSAGVEVRPLRQITGEAEFNEIFIEGARVPDENVVGGVGNGWAVAITTLMHERSGLGAAAAAGVRLMLDDLVALARERGVADDPLVRDRIAQLKIEVEALRLTSWRGLSRIQRHGVPGPEGSLPKWQWSEISQRLTELAIELRGEDGPVWDSPWVYRFLRARANSIEGGTTEILKNIVAERVLGLPKLR
jgi:alkylation response protein AidB-like acyl-CoA dehydrogenase